MAEERKKRLSERLGEALGDQQTSRPGEWEHKSLADILREPEPPPPGPLPQNPTLSQVLAHRHAEQAYEEHQVARAIAWLQEKWREVSCPYCAAHRWEIGSVLEIPLRSGNSLTPVFPVMCGNCGHTTFINAVVAGLIAEPEWE